MDRDLPGIKTPVSLLGFTFAQVLCKNLLKLFVQTIKFFYAVRT